MAKNSIPQETGTSNERAEVRVSDEIHRAAARAGIEPSDSVAELESLRSVAAAALQSFESRGLMSSEWTAADILHEALLCAQTDFGVIHDACYGGPGVVDSMVFRRAELRIDLGIALANHCEKFGLLIPRQEIGGES